MRDAVSVRDALDGAATALRAGGAESPRLDAELLLADAMRVPREALHRDPDAAVRGSAVHAFQSHVRRRAGAREPVAYILGRRAFRRLELDVDARVLVPRPETELLVEIATVALTSEARVLDCCCGSGAVALALKDERPDLEVWGADVDAGALAVAAANARRLGLDVRLERADLLAGLPDGFAAIVANPPYVASGEIAGLEPEISRHEPRLALDGGADGLAVIRRLVAAAAATSVPLLLLEHGGGQHAAVAELCRAAGFAHVAHHRDLARIERVLEARR